MVTNTRAAPAVQSAQAAQAAPAGLEPVRSLLNSWLIPNDSRQPTDRFADLARDRGWDDQEAARLQALRDDLRRLIESGVSGTGAAGTRTADGTDEAACINQWIDRLGVRPVVSGGHLAYCHQGGHAGDLLSAVISAFSAGTWKRLKACPDCHWVFYDHTRNGSKRWCLMYAGGPEGRACGTIAKVRRYRERQSADAEPLRPA